MTNLVTGEMDDLLLFCFKCALKGKIGKSDLPLLTSNLLKGYMQPFRYILITKFVFPMEHSFILMNEKDNRKY